MVLQILTSLVFSAAVEGRVLSSETEEPLSWAAVEVAGTGLGTAADSLGRFRLSKLSAGRKTLVASCIGYLPDTVALYLSELQSIRLTFRLKPEPLTLPPVEVTSPPSIIERAEHPPLAFGLEDLHLVPGNFGNDPLRSIPALTGVGLSQDEWAGPPAIRGGETDENPVYYDGVELPWAWHLAGLASVINSDLVESVTLCRSAIPIRYDALSAVTLVSSLEVEKGGGRFAYDPLGLKVAAWTPVGKRLDAAASLRKTLYHIKLGPIGYNVDPDFYDAALKLGATVAPGVRLTAGHLSGEDDLGNNFRERISLYRIALGWQGRAALEICGSYTRHRLTEGASLFAPRELLAHETFAGRADLSWNPTGFLELAGGQEISWESTLEISDAVASTSYAQAGLELPAKLFITAGLRIVRVPWTQGLWPAPRFSISWKPSASLSAGAGYRDSYQHPFRILRSSFYKTDTTSALPLDYIEPGLASLYPKRAQQYSVWLDMKPDSLASVKLEAYYRQLSRLPLLKDDSTWEGAGYGHAEGAELTIAKRTRFGLSGELSYSLAWSKRMEGDLEELCWGEYDQRHIMSMTLRQTLPQTWTITAAFRLSTGLPYTPIIEDSSGQRLGIPYSERAPLYHRLDVKVEKNLPHLPLSPYFYIEILNLYNSQNPYRIWQYVDSSGTIKSAYYGRVPFLILAGIGGSF